MAYFRIINYSYLEYLTSFSIIYYLFYLHLQVSRKMRKIQFIIFKIIKSNKLLNKNK
jgi:hypothetical protein